MEGKQNLCLIFSFLFCSTMVTNSLEEFVSSNLFDLNNVNAWTQLLWKLWTDFFYINILE
jgi:hypothetical protein